MDAEEALTTVPDPEQGGNVLRRILVVIAALGFLAVLIGAVSQIQLSQTPAARARKYIEMPSGYTVVEFVEPSSTNSALKIVFEPPVGTSAKDIREEVLRAATGAYNRADPTVPVSDIARVKKAKVHLAAEPGNRRYRLEFLLRTPSSPGF